MKYEIDTIEPIEWKFSRPTNFPCFKCKQKEAEWIVKVRGPGGMLTLPLCQGCMGVTAQDLWNFFTTKRIR